jgi:hypothetical protein
MKERWAREEEMYRNGEISLFGLTRKKKIPPEQPSAISPKTDKLLSRLKGKR